MNIGRTFLALTLGLTTLGVVAAATTFLGDSDDPGSPSIATANIDSETIVAGDDLDQTIGALQTSLAEREDARGYTALGVAYLQKVRETGDPTYYTQAEGVLDKALELDPNNFEALTSKGALALARHDFEGALELGLKAKEINPDNAHNYGVIGDALLELGRYDEAFEAFQTMVDTRPDLSSYARISYARELTGDIEGAIIAMEQAREAGGGRPENVAFTAALVGNLYFGKGDLDRAELEYSRANAILPDYPPALAGLGRGGPPPPPPLR
ncbi:MAG: tetratricopeptide repeat protein [Dehalococcoidia bacterium]